ncbi:esterase-like activity of phytase family protein [Mesorhizobium sp. KR1-2]|uniref:esterase-like activity of phytase family protein n=1 Tax=Mesorhizobium sp. KR1-2 TaxID=3156609 RepID=UPI0032B51E5A
MRLFPARLLGLLLAAALGATRVAPLHAEPARVERMDVTTRQITRFHIGRDETRFGPLEFVGGLEMVSPSRHFGGFSAMRFLAPGKDFIGVADTGFWFFGRVTRDAEQRPTGVTDFRMVQMVDEAGKPIDDKWRVDAEGLAVKDGVATVGFERDHRVAQFRIDPDNMRAAFRRLDFLVPKHELRMNRSFEAVAYAPESGALKGALVVVTERSLDKQGNVFAAVLDGPRKGVFTVVRSDGFDVTDGAFLPNGDLLLLERSFTIMQGVRMRLRRLPADSIGKGKVADGPVLMQADMNYQIDNMEAMDVWRRADGALMVSLMSDDNQSILQRSLYLEFLLREE